MLFLKSLVGLHRTINFSFFSVTGWGIDLDYSDIGLFALETNRDHSVIFESASKSAFWTLLLTMKANPFLLMEVDIIVDIMVTILDKMVNSRCSRYNCPLN